MDSWNPFQIRVKPVLLCSVDKDFSVAVLTALCPEVNIHGAIEGVCAFSTSDEL